MTNETASKPRDARLHVEIVSFSHFASIAVDIVVTCLTDVRNIQKYLTEVQGFKESEMLILMDDGRHHAPTRKNIEDAFRRITEYSNAGDVVFVHYSGHGGRVVDTSGDEDDGYDETLIPVDFRSTWNVLYCERRACFPECDYSSILLFPFLSRRGTNCRR